ncbi:V-type ATP synthase subunit D [Candidatus Bipolaricaulota bacterium]|nr:V-type ATP synthase subunit D [Candidatus Bipolaricaulota bacterium]
MAQLIKVRPTKIELVKLKRRLGLSSRIHKIMKDRLSILTMEFLQAARQTVTAKQHTIDAMNQAYKAMTIASGYHGYVALQKELSASQADITVTAGPRNVAGVRIPSLELNEPTGGLRGYNMAQTSSLVDSAADTAREALRAIIELAELQRGLELLGTEINRTKRIANALEYILIPNLKATIRFLAMKFEERDREEKARLKRVKVILARKEA